MTFTAKYKGYCTQCDDPVIQGQEVEYDLDRQIQHVVCPDPVTGSTKPRPICPACFLEVPTSGVCECRA